MEIVDDFKKTNELSEALNVLKIIINYAITTSHDPNELVIKFMEKIYIKNSETPLKNKVIYNK